MSEETAFYEKDRLDVENSKKTHNQKIETNLSEIQKIMNNSDLTPEARQREINLLKLKMVEAVGDSNYNFISNYRSMERRVHKAREEQGFAYMPKNTEQETLFELKKLNEIRRMERMSEDEILDKYKNIDDPMLRQIYEDEAVEIVRSKNTMKSRAVAFRLNKMIDLNRASRLSDKTKKEIEYLSEQKELYDFTLKFQKELDQGKLRPQMIHAWFKTSNSEYAGFGKGHPVWNAQKLSRLFQTP